MSKADTWMPLYIGDYLRDTGHLTAVEHGAYLLLLMQAWTRGGALPADETRLRTIAKLDQKEWKRSGRTILEFFQRDGDTLRHKRLDRELANATALTEQRKAAGKASAEARARKQNGNEPPNENPTSVERALNGRWPAVATNGQQNARPSPSPLQEEDSVLRTDAVASSGPELTIPDLGIFGEQEPAAKPKAKADPKDPKNVLWNEGKAIMERLAAADAKSAGKLVGSFVDDAKAKAADGSVDYALVLEVLRDAEKQRPDNPIPWIKATIKSRLSSGIVGTTTVAPDDPWGIRAWTSRQLDVGQGTDPATDKKMPAINGHLIERSAELVAEQAGLAESWRGNWDAIGAWMRADLGFASYQTLRAIGDQARRMTADGQAIRSIAVFDATVRAQVMAAA
jgi:uncharacterized protein YdaU (DUF1376 family)